MIATDERWQQLWAAFAAELEDRVPALTTLLLDLEHGPDDEPARKSTFDALFREVHSLKGAARAVELPEIERLAHAFESALDSYRTQCIRPSAEWFDAAFAAADTFGQLHRSAMNGSGVPPEFPAVLARLAAAQLAILDVATPVPALPAQTQPANQPIVSQANVSSPTHPTSEEPAVTVEGGSRAATESIRVSVVKLDQLLSQAGELAVTHIRIEQRAGDMRTLRDNLLGWQREWRGQRMLRISLQRFADQADASDATPIHEIEALLRFTERSEQRMLEVLQQVEVLAQRFRQDAAELGVVAQRIEDDVMAVRLLPVTTIFGPFQRLIRDLQRDLGKDVELVLHGGEIEIDRTILEQLRDPLMHMLRNAVDHGIEGRQERLTAGKSPRGTIYLEISQIGGSVTLVLSDDGSGLDPQRLRAAAQKKGLLSAEQVANLNDQQARELIFEPGFSTSATITGTSGRGVGMDVVREHIERLNGHITTTSNPGFGTRFTITVPQTLATTRAIVLEQCGQLFAIPSVMTERNARVKVGDIVSVEGRRAVVIDGHPVPIVELADVLERPPVRTEGEWRTFFVLRKDDRRVALLTDRLVGEQEIVVKQLMWPLRHVRNVAGAAVLGSGHTAIVLNPVDVFKTSLQLLGSGARPQPKEVMVADRRSCILVVDDSLTTRTLERSILEAAGYQTVAAADGVEALAVLRQQAIDLVVSDIEMPRLDGFGLTAAIRSDERLRQIPVVLITSLDAREHQERGVAVGADAYVIKSSFDQGHLLQTIGRLL